MNVSDIKKDFPIFQRKINGKDLVYLDSAATSQKPKQVIDSIVDFYSQHNANIHRGIYTLSEESTKLYEESKTKIAEFINAKSSKEIIYTKNSTESINLVAYSWGERLTPEDTVILSITEHHSDIVPWQIKSQKQGFKILFTKVNNEFQVDLEELENLLNNNSVKLIGISHISNLLGTKINAKEIIDLAHKYGALVLLDASQSVPHIKVDVQELDCDFMVFSGHKMLGPTGIGVLYAKQSLLENMPPFLSGGDMIEEVTQEYSTYTNLPYKFEAGTPNVEGAVGLSKAIEYLQNIGMENISQHEKELTKYALGKLQTLEDITIYGPSNSDNRYGIISFNLKGIHPHDVAQILDTEGVEVRSGFHCAMPLVKSLGIDATTRVSFYLYNTREDIDFLMQSLSKVKQVFK